MASRKSDSEGLVLLTTKGGRSAAVRPSTVASIADDGSEGHSTVTLLNGGRLIAEGTPEEVAAALGIEVAVIEEG